MADGRWARDHHSTPHLVAALEHRLPWDEAVERCRAVLDEAVRCRVERPPAHDERAQRRTRLVRGRGHCSRLGRDDLLVGRLVFAGPAADERGYSDAVIHHWGSPVSSGPWLPTEDESAALTVDLRRPPPDPNFTMFADLHRSLLTAAGTRA